MYNTPTPKSPFTRRIKFLHEYIVQDDMRFLRLYDKEVFEMEGIWLFGINQLDGKTPEQLQEMLALPFVPKFICDVFMKPTQKVLMYRIMNDDGLTDNSESVAQVEDGLTFINETPLLPNVPAHRPQASKLQA